MTNTHLISYQPFSLWIIATSLWLAGVGCAPTNSSTTPLPDVSVEGPKSQEAPSTAVVATDLGTVEPATATGAASISSTPSAVEPVNNMAASLFDAAEQPTRPVDGAQLREEADKYFDELVQRVPDSPDALEVQARFKLLIGQTQQARQCWQNALKIAPEYRYAEQGLGKVAMLEGEVPQAIEHFERALVGLPDNVDLLQDLAEAYTRNSDVQKAIDALERAVKHHPDSAGSYVQLGHAHLSAQQFEPARSAFEAALKLAPKLPRAEQGLGMALMRLGRADEARQLLASQKANRNVGKNRSTEETFQDEITEVALRYQYAARVYLASGDLQRAEFFLRRATILKPRSDAAWEPLLSFYRTQNRPEQAIATAEQMCQSVPNNPSYHFTLAMLLAKSGHLEKAQIEFDRVHELAPQDAECYAAQARVFIELRRELQQAIDLSGKAVQLRGRSDDYELLAQSLAVNQQFTQAHKALSRAIELAPENKNYQVAMEQLQRVLPKAP